MKKGRRDKNINELDEIDKEFKKKWMALTSKKWIPTRKDQKKGRSSSKGKMKIKAEILSTPTKEGKYDAIKEVKSIF